MRRAPRTVVAALALLVAAGTAGTAEAQVAAPAPPTVEVRSSSSQVAVTGAEALLAGPTRMVFSTPRSRYRYLTVHALSPGTTLAAYLRRARDDGSTRRLAAPRSGSVVTAARSQTVILTLAPSTRYAVVDQTAASPKRWFGAEFVTAAESSGAVAPAPVATVTMSKYRFTGDAVLPRAGVVRFENLGPVGAWATAFRLKPGVSTTRVRRAMSKPTRPLAGLVVGRTPLELHGMIEAGVANDVELSLPKAGRYVLICERRIGSGRAFHQRGMWRVVTVR